MPRLVVLALALLVGLVSFLVVKAAGELVTWTVQVVTGTAGAALELPGDAWRWTRSTTRRVLRLEERPT